MKEEDTKKSLDKRMTLKEAISKFVFEGCSVAFGGMAGAQSIAPTYEIIRQGQKSLTLIGDSPADVADFLLGTGQIKRMEIAWLAYAIAGLSPSYRRAMEEGLPHKIELREFSNYTMGLRFLAGAMGIPFMVARSLTGTSLEKYNDMIKVMEDPYEGKKVALVPAARPDVGIVHANRADMLGNTQFLGFSANGENIARAAKRTIITCEKIVPTDAIRKAPSLTVIPQYVVDAVVEVPFCSHPWNMPFEYAYDLPFNMAMVREIDTPDGFKRWMDKWAFGCQDHDEYCEKVGRTRLKKLAQIERKFCKNKL
jgi:glutaconate CoA-transferase subunit A